MPELVGIQNKSPRAKSILFRGREIIIDGHSSGDFDKSVAEKFLEVHRGVITRADDIGTVYEADLATQEMVWLANMTGNPDSPETAETAGHWSKAAGNIVRSNVPHPCREAMTIRRPYDLGQKEYVAKDGAPEGLNLQSVMIELPPYTRRQFPKDIASWMLTRDGTAGQEFSGRLMKSRPPSAFEPDMSWELDNMRVYLRLADPGSTLGESENTIRANIKDKKEADIEVEKAKRRVWTRLFFCLVDPTVRLPTRSEFNEYIEKHSPKEKA